MLKTIFHDFNYYYIAGRIHYMCFDITILLLLLLLFRKRNSKPNRGVNNNMYYYHHHHPNIGM